MIVNQAVYEHGRRLAEPIALEDTYDLSRREGVFAWIGLLEPTEEEFESVRREFGLHELAVEDAITAHQRPKLEFYGDSLFIVLKTARWIDPEERIELGEILIFVGDGFIVSVRHGEPSLREVQLQVEQRPDLLAQGPSAALYAIVDRVVDDYEPVIEELDSSIRETETDVFSPSPSNPSGRIYQLKRAVLDMHTAVAPLVPPLEKLATIEHPLIDVDIRPYFRDIHDHLLLASGRVEGFRELLTSVLAANLTQARRAPERGRAQDLGLGGDDRGANADQRDLRHELRAHAGAHVEARIPACTFGHGSRVLPALPAVPPGGLALTATHTR